MMSLVIVCIGIIACIVLSGVFSASEMAISSCNTVRMENEAEDGDKRAARVMKLNDNYDNTYGTVDDCRPASPSEMIMMALLCSSSENDLTAKLMASAMAVPCEATKLVLMVERNMRAAE